MSSAEPSSRYDWIVGDLAPGCDQDEAILGVDLEAKRVASAAAPEFASAYAELWNAFGAAGEMEPERMIRARLGRGAHAAQPGWCVLYELAAVERAGRLVAVRDMNAVARVEPGTAFAVVHLSHVLVTPALRGRGLAAWLRAFPLQTARRALAAVGAPVDSPVTLVAEMEHPDEPDVARLHRLRSYGRAGFRAIDPRGLDYRQPDFREPAEVDAAGGPRPIPMRLVIRRVGREAETTMPWGEVLAIVESLFRMYALDFRWSDIAPLWERQCARPLALDAPVPLVDPLAPG